MNLTAAIAEFHEKFELAYRGAPRQLPPDLQHFRTKFMREELHEYEEAVILGHKAKQLDALVDLVYVAVGTAYLSGFDFNAAFQRVHLANMKKVRTQSEAESTRGSTYDVVKPPGWTPPDLTDLVEPAG